MTIALANGETYQSELEMLLSTMPDAPVSDQSRLDDAFKNYPNATRTMPNSHMGDMSYTGQANMVKGAADQRAITQGMELDPRGVKQMPRSRNIEDRTKEPPMSVAETTRRANNPPPGDYPPVPTNDPMSIDLGLNDIMKQLDIITTAQDLIAPKPTKFAEGVPQQPSASEAPTEQSKQPGDLSPYERLVKALEGTDFSSNIFPRPEVFAELPWRQKLGTIIASSMMLMGPGRGPVQGKNIPEKPGKGADALDFWKEGLSEYDKIEHPVINTLKEAEKGGSNVAANLLEAYRKIDSPTVRQEFGNIIKEKIKMAAEGGETRPSNITNPEIKRWTPEEDNILKGAIKDGKIDFNNLPPELADRSVGALTVRAQDLQFIEAAKRYQRQVGDSGSIHSDKFPKIIESIKEGKSYADIGKDVGLSGPNVRMLIARNPELRKVRQETPSKATGAKWTPDEDRILADTINNPNIDIPDVIKGLEHRSPGAVDTRIEYLRSKGMIKDTLEEGAKPFTPKGAVMAPETGGGSGTTLTGKSGVHIKDLEKGQEPGDILYVQRGQLIKEEDMMLTGDNKNLTPKTYGENVARKLIRNWRTPEELQEAGITAADINALVEKHGPGFQEFQKFNPDRSSASVASKYMELDRAIGRDLTQLARDRMHKYDVEAEAQRRRKDLRLRNRPPEPDK